MNASDERTNAGNARSGAVPEAERKAEIAAGLAAVQERVVAACAAAGREPSSVRVVAVSKFKPASDLRLAYELGVRDFGENYVQELASKQVALADLRGIRWHLIGHLQRNKARVLAQDPPILHTLDDVRLAEELDKRLTAADTRTQVLVQVNIADESQKAGCAPSQLPELCAALQRFSRLQLSGLMIIPPASEDPEASRPLFRELERLRQAACPGSAELSMGMSHDFAVAIAEGATLVRVGTAIFGQRS